MILAFSGGTPLLRQDIFKLIARAVERDLVVYLATNGALVTDALSRRLKEAGVQSVTVSLDGASAETHDSIRRFPGLFERTVAAIEKLSREDLRVVVSFTPMLLNYREGPDVVRLACDSGASAVNMSEYVPAGRGTHDLALPPETLRNVVHQWIEMRRAYEGKIQIIWHDCRVALTLGMPGHEGSS